MKSLQLKTGSLLIAAGLLVGSNLAQAMPMLSFDNAEADISKTYTVGDKVTLNVWMSGLNATDLGGFDFDMGFGQNLLAHKSSVFGTDLTASNFFGLQAKSKAAGSLSYSGVSLDTDLSGQADQLKLFTVEFDALAAGKTTLGFSNALFADALANGFQASLYQANIRINDKTGGGDVKVSEPASLALLGFAGLLLLRRRAVK